MFLKQKRKMNCWEKIFFGFTTVCFLIWIVTAVLGAFKIYEMDQNYRELKQDISIVNQHDKEETVNEYTQTIDFLENEMNKYRDFAERQQNFLIWLIGLLGVGLTALIGFFEIKGRSDISRIIQEQYQNSVRKEFESLIGGEERVQYLESSIEKEQSAKNKKILFIFQNDASIALNKVYKIMKIQSYHVDKINIDNTSITDRKIRKWVRDYELIIYQVASDESWKKDEDSDPEVVYARIAKACDDYKTYGILYCENGIKTAPDLLKESFYTGPANFSLTLMERMYSLLYFIGNGEESR